MRDKCPCCEREFLCLEDYPVINIISFEKINIPTSLLNQEYIIYVGPKSKANNEKAPAEVLAFFKLNHEAKEFEHQGWHWTLEKDNLKEDCYLRHRYENFDQRDIIIAKLNPYLDSLEKLIGKEVLKEELLPQFEKDRCFKFAYNIPETEYKLAFHEQEETPTGLRITELQLLGEGENLGMAGGPTLKIITNVGLLKYQGKTRKY